MNRIDKILASLAFGLFIGWGVSAVASRSSTGTYTLPAGNPVVTNTTITSTWANTTLADLSTEITGSLSRNGYGGMLAALRGVSGSAAAPAFSFTSDTNSGMYRAGADDVRLAVNGVDALDIGTASGGAAMSGTAYVSVPNLTVYNYIRAYSGSLSLNSPLQLTGALTAVSSSGSSFSPNTVYTGTAGPGLSVTGRNGTTGGGAAVSLLGGDATVSGQGGVAISAQAGASITGGAAAITAAGNGSGDGITATGGTSGYGATLTAGGTARTPLHLTTSASSTPLGLADGDVFVLTSGPLAWRANSTTFAPYKGTCILGTSCAAIAVGQATGCQAQDTTSAAATKAVMASTPPTSTVTFTGNATDTLFYTCL